jgi:hypothetical protein
MRRSNSASRSNGRPDGVTSTFEVVAYKIEPAVPDGGRNLLSKEHARPAGVNEREPVMPQVPVVRGAFALAGRAERLARAASGPDCGVVRHAGKTQGKAPPADAGKEVALSITAQIVWAHVGDRALVDVAVGNVPRCDEVAEPLRCTGIDLVVVGMPHVPSARK